MADEDYEVRITGDTRDYVSSVDQATTSTNALNAAIVAAGASLKNLYDRGQRGLTIIAGGQVAGITAVTLAAARLDQQMSQLQAHSVLVDKSFSSYNTTVSKLRQNFGLASGDAIALVTQLNKLGQQPQHIEKMVGSYVKLSAVTGESVNALAQGQTQFMRQMGAAAPAVDKYSSMFANLSSKMGVSAQGTIDFANQIAPLSKTMGMSATQIAGVSAAFNQAGSDGFAAANAYTKILTDVNRAIRYGGPELQVYANILGTTAENMKSMPASEQITGIFKALNDQGPNAVKTLEAIGLEGVRTQRSIAGVMRQGGLETGMTTAQQGFVNQGPFDAASQKALSGFMDSMGKIGETFKTFGQQVGSVFLPAANMLAAGINTMLTPLRALGEMFSNLSQGQRNLVSVAAALGVALPLMLKAVPAMWSLGLLGQATRGPFAMGARAGFNPGGREMDAQRTFRQGGGNAVQRMLFNAGMFAGDLANPRGARGDLNDRGPWMRPTAFGALEQYQRRSSGAARIDWLKSQGFIDPDYDASQDRRGRNMLTRATTGAIGFAGQFARMGLAPLQPGYMANSMGFNKDALTQSPTMREAMKSAFDTTFSKIGFSVSSQPTGSGMVPTLGGQHETQQQSRMDRLRTSLFTRQGLDESVQEIKRSAGEIGKVFKGETKAITQHTEEVTKSRGVFRTLGSEGAKLARSLGSAGVGLGAGGAMAGARIGGRIGSAALGAVGGPQALAIGGAMVLGGTALAARESAKQAEIKGEDVGSVGSDYRDALGIATVATRTFAEEMAISSRKIAPAAKDMSEALTVTNANLADVNSSSREITDQKLKSIGAGDIEGAKAYAGQYLAQGRGVQETEALKYDLIQQYGGSTAQDILDTAQKNQGNLFNLVRQENEGQWGGVIKNLFTDEQVKRRGDMAADTMIEQQNRAGETRGPRGRAETGQAQINQYFADVLARGGSGRNAQAYQIDQYTGDQASRQGFNALMQGMQLAPDKESREATQKTLNELYEYQRKNPAASPEDMERITQEAITRNYEGTAFGARTAEYRAASGIYPGTTIGKIGEAGVNPIDQYANFARDARWTTTQGGQLAMNLGQQGFGGSLTRALEGGIEDPTKVSAAVDDMVAKMHASTGDWDKTTRELQLLADASTGATNGLKEIALAAEQRSKEEGEFAYNMAGRGTLTERMGRASNRLGSAEDLLRQNPDSPEAAKRVEGARAEVKGLANEQLERLRGVAEQYRQLEFQREQGLAQMERSQARQLRDFNKQQGFAEEDFATQRARNLYQFNLQRERAEDTYYRNRARQERNFQLQQSRAIADFNRSRERAEDDFNRSLARGSRDRNIQLERQRADFNRSRRREEEDYQTTVKRMTAETAKSVYDIYSRVNVQRTWDAENLLQNMADQQQRLVEQQANLRKARGMGLSDEAISMMGLEQTQNAQQLERLVQGLETDPRLVAEYNKMVKNRTTESGKLMRDSSNTSFKNMEEDRKKNIKRQDEDFKRGVDQSAEDYNRSVDDARADFQRSQDRSERDFQRSLKRSNKDYRLATAEQNEDFRRGMEESKKDFILQMQNSYDDFNKLKVRQRDLMKQGWEDMRGDFDFQMDLQVQSINKFAEDVSLSFDEARKIVGTKATKEIEAQLKAMDTLMDGFKSDVLTSVKELDAEVKKPFDQWDVSPKKKAQPLPGKRQPMVGGPGDDASGTPSASGPGGSGGDETGWPVTNHTAGTPWGKAGSWKGSRTLGPGYHSGADFPMASGSTIRAAADGTVKSTRYDGDYGNMTIISHGNGVETWYAHQLGMNVNRGDQVAKGDKIGTVGETGRAFGAHLHLELVVNGKDKDPIPWLKGTDSGGNFNVSPSSDGGGDHDFKSGKAYKKFEALIEKLGYFEKNRSPFHSGMRYEKGALGDAISSYLASHADTSPGGSPGSPGSPDTGGKTGARGIWNALRSGGLTEKQAAGVMGNMYHESGLKWNIHQIGGGGGYGLVQWTPGSKLHDILKKGKRKDGLENQIWALFQQLAGKSPHPEAAAGRDLKKQNSVFGATKSFLREYERAADTSDAVVNRRAAKSNEYYKSFHGDATPDGGEPDISGPSKGKPKNANWYFLNDSSSSKTKATGKHIGTKFGIKTIGGYRSGSKSGMGYHQWGQALDVMVNDSGHNDSGLRKDIAAYSKSNKDALDIIQIIEGIRIWTQQRSGEGWRYYGGGGHANHVHLSIEPFRPTADGGYAGGTNSARPGWHLTGENGPELWHAKGGETVLSAAQSAVAASKATEMVTRQNSVYQTNIDNSANYSGDISVYAADLSDFQAQLEAQARMNALTKPPKSKVAA